MRLKIGFRKVVLPILCIALAGWWTEMEGFGQDTVRYTGSVLANPDYHHGELKPVIGAHNIQVFRANRENPQWADGEGWTYHHGPNIAYWNNRFYVQYLSNPVGEHIAPGEVSLTSSEDGYNWDAPVVLFPPYKIPDGTTKAGTDTVAVDLYSVLHQRMGFYLAKNYKLLTLGYYGISLTPKDSPNDGQGIGRVVREINKDGSFGPIYFIRYNSNWNQKNTSYPFYKKSKNKAFVKACDELLSDPLMMMQWVEEADRDDELIPLKKQYKAFSYYHLSDNRVVGFWKHALSAISEDGGLNWSQVERAPGFVNKNAKIWAQKLSDNTYATVYNPSQFRWPLALSTSKDGLNYDDLYLINGEISTMRYGGQHKSYGPQYVRGILEGNGTPPDKNMWVTYSMNKEDIWVSKVPVPILRAAEEHVDDQFSFMAEGEELNKWNIFSPLWASVKVERAETGEKWLTLRDKDPYDYGVAERLFPASTKISAEFVLKTDQSDHGLLHIELQDETGHAALRLIVDSDGTMKVKDGYNFSGVGTYTSGREYNIRIEADAVRNYFEVFVDGKKAVGRMCFAPVKSFSRIAFRSGERRYYPNIESPGMQQFDVENGGTPVEEAVFSIKSLKTIGE